MEAETLENLIHIENGNPVKRTFSDAEYGDRLNSLRMLMNQQDIGSVLFSSYHNINYYSGFHYCYFGRLYGLAVTHETSTSISANIDGGQPWRRTFGNNIVYTDWQRDNYFRAVQNVIQDGGRVGIEFDDISIQNLEKLKAALPGTEFIDISVATMKMRMVKSAEEISVIKDGARIADLGGEVCRYSIAEGVSELEVSRASTEAMVKEIARSYPDSELMDTWTWFQSGINTDGAHNPVTTRKMEKGDILSLNCFPMISGYYTALERTLFLDHATDRHLELWEVNCQVHRRGLELIRPGVRCCDIANELNEIYKEHDLLQYRTFGYGHSFGVLSHYYGREAGLELREDIETVLEPNMVISMEPMIMLPEGLAGSGGYREHDILVLTEDGAENITKFPFGPEYNIVKA